MSLPDARSAPSLKHAEAIDVSVDDGLALFRTTGLFRSLSRRQQGLAEEIVLRFTDAMWAEHGQRRSEWDEPEVRACCEATLHRTLPAHVRFPDVAAAPLVAYLLFLHEHGLHEEGFACACAVYEVAEAVVGARGGAAPALRAGPNEPCPCGSGTKFKRCHGAVDAPRGMADPDDILRPNPYARAALLEAVRNQLDAGEPPEARAAHARLLAQGWPEPEARAALAGVLAEEVFDVLRTRQPGDMARYAGALRRLG